jgi:hypothetical protein
MTVIGIGLLVGSLFGRARGLIVLGVILTPVLLFSPIAELDFGDTDVRYEPATVADIAPFYELDVGQHGDRPLRRRVLRRRPSSWRPR